MQSSKSPWVGAIRLVALHIADYTKSQSCEPVNGLLRIGHAPPCRARLPNGETDEESSQSGRASRSQFLREEAGPRPERCGWSIETSLPHQMQGAGTA